MVKFGDRVKAAMQVFRHGYGGETKTLPFSWPINVGGRPEWHLVDLQTFIDEGYSMNTLVYSAIMYKVRAIMTAPLRAYSGTPEDSKLLSRRHPLSMRLARPNKYQSWVEFQSRNIVFLNVTGNVYIYVDPFTGEMQSLSPQRMYIVPNKNNPAELMGYVYVPQGVSVSNLRDCTKFLVDDIMHIKLPNPGDPLEGLGYGISPLQPAAQSVDVDNMITGFLNIFFKRGAMVTGVLKYDIPINEDIADRALERWNEKFGGYKSWQIGILDRGASYERVSLTFEEMGFEGVDGRGETRILGPFGVAPILVGAKIGLEASTYSNYEAARQAVWEDTLIPESTLFEVEFQNRFDTDTEFVQFDYSQVPALQRALPRQVDAAYTLVQMGVPPNQAMRAAGLRIGKIPGGDVRMILSGPGRQQGPRSDPETDDFGMREDVPE